MFGSDVKLAWAKSAEGRLVHVTDVPRGKACNCACPACDQPLIAKPGHGRRRPHFSHGVVSECSEAPSLAKIVINLLARQVLQDVAQLPTLHLPPQTYQIPHIDPQKPVITKIAKPAQEFTPERLLTTDETGLGGLGQNVLVVEGANGSRLALVLHDQMTQEEVNALRHAGIPALRYDLEVLTHLDITSQQILDSLSSKRQSREGQWIFSRLAEDKLSKSLDELDRQRKEAIKKSEMQKEERRIAAENAKRERQSWMRQEKLKYDALFKAPPENNLHHSEITPASGAGDYEKILFVRQVVFDHIVSWIDDTLDAMGGGSGDKSAALAEAQQGAWARLQARLPKSDPVWQSGVLTGNARQLVESGALDALERWCRSN